jgi:plastocyanin
MKLPCLLIGVSLMLGCGGGGSAGAPTGPTGPTGPTVPTGPGGASGSANVTIQGGTDIYGEQSFSFSPGAVAITRNGAVTWANTSGAAHNVTFDGSAGAPANVGEFTSGNVSRTFGTAGVFPYQCTLHPGMSGQVTVQ